MTDKLRFRKIDMRLLADLWNAFASMSEDMRAKLHLRYHLRLNPLYKQITLDNFLLSKKEGKK